MAAIFARLATYLLSRKTLRDKTVSALVYPAFILSVVVVGLVLLAIFVLPNLTGMISSMNAKAAQQYQLNIEGFQVKLIITIILFIIIALGVTLALVAKKTRPLWAIFIDGLFLKIPGLRGFLAANFGLNFAFAMETLLNSGYTLEEALQEGEAVAENQRFALGLSRAREKVMKGLKFSESLQEENVFPSLLVGWMAIGEGAHDLVKSFAQIRTYYQSELDKLFTRVMNLAEPVLIAVVGAILLMVIMTFITPIFTMMQNVL